MFLRFQSSKTYQTQRNLTLLQHLTASIYFLPLELFTWCISCSLLSRRVAGKFSLTQRELYCSQIVSTNFLFGILMNLQLIVNEQNPNELLLERNNFTIFDRYYNRLEYIMLIDVFVRFDLNTWISDVCTGSKVFLISTLFTK